MKIGFITIMIFLIPSIVFVQDIIPIPVVPDADFFQKLFEIIGGWKALVGGGLTLALIQLVIIFLKTNLAGNIFHGLSGTLKFLLVNGLTLVAGLFTAVGAGASWGQAIAAMFALPMFQEFLFQIYKQFIVKKTA